MALPSQEKTKRKADRATVKAAAERNARIVAEGWTPELLADNAKLQAMPKYDHGTGSKHDDWTPVYNRSNSLPIGGREVEALVAPFLATYPEFTAVVRFRMSIPGKRLCDSCYPGAAPYVAPVKKPSKPKRPPSAAVLLRREMERQHREQLQIIRATNAKRKREAVGVETSKT